MDDLGVASATIAQGERRQITAVFVDIVGFSAIASKADPEDLQVWLETFYAKADAIIAAHDGEITEYLGDGIVALFGHDLAEELAALKAVNAAMATLEAINGRDIGIPVQLRIGVATGEAALRAPGHDGSRPKATGLVTTLAQRIQERAVPGSVLMAQSTQNLLRGSIATAPFQNERLKGFAEAQTLYRPLAGQSATPVAQEVFVGRAGVLHRIRESREAVLVVGPAGIGKSAVVRHLAQDAVATTFIMANGVYARASYHPFVHWILQQTDNPAPQFTDLKAQFTALSHTALQALALIMGLPEGQRLVTERSNMALKTLIEESLWQAIRATQPQGMLVFEDLHWLDNASFDVLTHIIASQAAARYKIVMTSREDSKISAGLDALPVQTFALGPLPDHEAEALLQALSGTKAPTYRRDAVVSGAGGIPLFIEQLFKRDASITGTRPDVPGSLKDLLASQIDATGPAKPVLQCASVIGQQFDEHMLRVIAADHEPLAEHLETACKQGVLRQDGPQSWTFVHALLQQAAYQSMLRQTRIDYHARIAAHLQDYHADHTLRNAALLTEHFSLAQRHVPAIQSALAASQAALFQGAFEDAEAYVLSAIDLCDAAPSDVDVSALRIASYAALGSIRMQTQGFSADPVKTAFETVARLAKDQDAPIAANGPAFYGSFSHAVIAGDRPAAVQFSDMLRDAAEVPQDTEQRTELRLASLNVDSALHFYSGDFDKASADFDALRQIYDIQKHGAMISHYGADTYAATQLFACVSKAIGGQAQLVPDLIAQTDAHQEVLNIPVMQPWAQIWGAVPLFYAGKTQTAVARVQQGLQTAVQQGAAFWQVTGTAWLHVMDRAQSYGADGLAGFRSAIKAHEAIGAHVGLPYFRAHYAIALARHDRIDDAYDASLRAIRENKANGLLCWYPEVLRLHAQVCDLRGAARGAARFRKEAAAVALQQNALLWLLRVRIDQRQSDEISAAELAAVVDRLPQDAMTPDVRSARKLLGAA